MNGEIMLDYIKTILEPSVKPGDVLFLDRLSSYLTNPVRTALAALGLTVVYFPAKTAPDLSPLDNCFFKLFKDNLRKRDCSTPGKKKAAALAAYAVVKRESILGCMRKCGLVIPPPQVEVLESKSDEEDVVGNEGENEEKECWMRV